MSSSKTNLDIPQVGRTRCPKSHPLKKGSLKDSGGGKDSMGKTILNIATLNVRTLRTEDRILQLEEELRDTKWDVIGLCEIKRTGEDLVHLKSGNILYYVSKDNTSEGVGFLVHKRWAEHITATISISTRVAYITLHISKRYQLKIIQIYAPTCTHMDEEVEEMYDDITTALEENKTNLHIIIGDFNAKVGYRQEGESCMGPYGTGIRNDRGQMLINFLEGKQHKIMNTFYQKKPQRKWTWKSPDGQTKNEIDFIITNKRHMVKDVTVLNNILISDHRMVRAKIKIDTKQERRKLLSSKRTEKDIQYIRHNGDKFENILETTLTREIESFPNINDLNTFLTDSIKESINKTIPGNKTAVKNSKISENTKEMIRDRNKNKRFMTSEQLKEKNKQIRRQVREDVAKYNERLIRDVIEENKGPRVFRKKLSQGKSEIITLKDENGNKIKTRTEILEFIRKFYENLYSKKVPERPRELTDKRAKLTRHNTENLPPISKYEIKCAMKKMKNNKAAGPDGIVIECIKMGGQKLLGYLERLFNLCLNNGEIPDSWKNANVIILYKKGDKEDIGNYRPISLLSHLYKLLTKILNNRIANKLDDFQPVEQAGFRRGYSTMDHLHTLRQVIEKSQEYNKHIYLAFIDFEKAFDTIEKWAFLNALKRCRIDNRYIQLVKALYDNATMTIQVYGGTDPIPVNRGVRQGDTISPKLFTTALEDIFKTLDWEKAGININGEHLSNLRFADDIVLLADKMEDLQNMLSALNNAAKKYGLQINASKTKIMSNSADATMVELGDDSVVQVVNEYIYLGQKISFDKNIQLAEINRRIQLGWAAYARLNNVFKTKFPQYLKTQVFNQCVLPTLTYAAETWILNGKLMDTLRIAQRKMERNMLGIRLQDRKTIEWIRQKTKVTDIAEHVARLKWKWAGHLMRTEDNRWTRKVTEWRPRGCSRNPGRPKTRWKDDIQKAAGVQWMSRTADRTGWRQLGEAYVQRWTETR